MSLRRHRLLLGSAVALAALIALLGSASFWAKRPLLHLIAARTGHEVRLNGFTLRLLTVHPHLTALDVSIANPPWSPPGQLGEISRVQLELAWQWSLLPLRIERLILEGARWHLRRDAQDRANWRAHEQVGAGPPLIGALEMPDAQVDLRDERRHLEFTGTVSAGEAAAASGPPTLHVAGQGLLNGRRASLVIDGDALAGAARGHPYHYTLLERSGASELRGAGYFEQPFDFRRMQTRFEIHGPNMQELYYLVGLRLIPTGAYRLSGTLERSDALFSYHELSAVSGDSDLGGELQVDSSSGRTQVRGALHSQRLRLKDLGERAAGQPQAATVVPGLPATPFRLAGLRRSDWRVTYRAAALEAGARSLGQLSATMSVEQGILEVRDLHAELAGGSLEGSGRFDAHAAIPRAVLHLSASGLELQALLPGHAGPPPWSGELDARAELSARGRSAQEMAADANGTVAAVLENARLRRDWAQAAGGELSGVLGLITHSQRETPVRCGVARLEADAGAVSVKTLVLDTDPTLITGAGSVQLGAGTVDLTLEGHPKHPGLGVRTAMAVHGTLAHPQVHVEGGKLAAQSAAAVALGAVLTPAAAVLGFVRLGRAHSPDCAELTRMAQSGTN